MVKLDGKPKTIGQRWERRKICHRNSAQRREKEIEAEWMDKRDYIGRKGRHIKYGAETEDDVIGKGREIGRK